MSYKEYLSELKWSTKLDALSRYHLDDDNSIRPIKERSWFIHRTIMLSLTYSLSSTYFRRLFGLPN